MTFTDAIKTCLSKYVTFSGRAARPEYWWFVLFIFLGALATGILDLLFFGPARPPGPQPTRLFQPLFQLATLLPLLAAGWRRMHDTGRPGWFLLLPLGVALASVLLVTGGALSTGMIPGAGMSGSGMEGGLARLSLIVFALAWLTQLILTILIIWWLTRPSEPDTNDYGPPPTDLSRAQ